VKPFDAGSAEAHELERAHLSLARFADSLLRAAATPPGGSSDTGGKGGKGKGTAAVSTMTAVADGDLADLRGLVVENTLQAMRLGSADARQMFPKLLPHLDQSEPLAARFAAHAAQVPCWAFLAWLPQMIAQLNDPPKARPLRGILTAVAEHYPNAIVLPLTISVPGLTFEPSQREDRQFAEALLARVTFEPLGIFIRELEKLHHPVGPDVCGWSCSCVCLGLLWWSVCAGGWFVSVLSVADFVVSASRCTNQLFLKVVRARTPLGVALVEPHAVHLWLVC
jgi:hypothetical protein